MIIIIKLILMGTVNALTNLCKTNEHKCRKADNIWNTIILSPILVYDLKIYSSNVYNVTFLNNQNKIINNKSLFTSFEVDVCNQYKVYFSYNYLLLFI